MAQKLFLTSYLPQELEALILNCLLKANEARPHKEPPTEPEDYITAKQAASMLHVSRPTLTKLVREGHLKGFRLGRNLRFKTGDVRRALQSISSIKYSRGQM
jgi:excisionase family DNA binding protein